MIHPILIALIFFPGGVLLGILMFKVLIWWEERDQKQEDEKALKWQNYYAKDIKRTKEAKKA